MIRYWMWSISLAGDVMEECQRVEQRVALWKTDRESCFNHHPNPMSCVKVDWEQSGRDNHRLLRGSSGLTVTCVCQDPVRHSFFLP